MKIRPITLLTLILLFSLRLFSQTAELRGQVVDEKGEPLIGANVYLDGTILGGATDGDGVFFITQVPPGDFTLVVNLIGYKEKKLPVRVSASQKLTLDKIALQSTVIANEPVVVTAGKYEQKIQDVPASLSTISQQELQYRNTVTIDDALEYVSGVNMNGSQISIRGSTGYSQGVGSRVLMLLDGIPMLTADTRDIVYSVIPTYMVKRIEVLKGAGSALYGSSALGGVINVITRDIDADPRLNVKVQGGIYSKPSHDEWRWTDDTQTVNGIDVNYSQKLGSVGVMAGGSRNENDSYKQNGWSKRWTGYGKLQWEISPFSQLILSGNYMWQKRGSFLFWQGLDNPLVPFPGQEDNVVISKRNYLTANYRHVFNKTRFLTFRGIWFLNRFSDTVSREGNDASSKNFNGEIQLTTKTGNVFVTGGVEGNWNSVNSNIFGNRDGRGAATYLQAEIPFTQKWRATFGTRFDYSAIDSVNSDVQLNPKVGLVFKPQIGMALRFAVGRGFRGPSMAEAFTSTVASGLQVIPNLNLKSEKSVYLEGGFNQLVGDWLIADLALFYSRFSDLIEANIIPSAEIQFQNIQNARIQGLEANLNGQFARRKVMWGVGYSYINARDIDNDVFLNFRPKHLLYAKTQLGTRVFRVGADYRFISRYDRIDERLTIFIPDAQARVAVHAFDLRISTNFQLNRFPLNVSVQFNNVLNYNYIDFVGSLAKPRHTIVAIEANL